MPNNLINAIAKQAKVDVDEVEEIWDLALKAKPNNYGYANNLVCKVFDYIPEDEK